MKKISANALYFDIEEARFVMPRKQTKFFNSTFPFRKALMVAGLAASLAAGLVSARANAAAGADAVPQAHSDGLGAAVADTAITANVKAKLMTEKSLKKSDISVTTTNGVVTLDGSASSSHAKSVAAAATRSVDGVKSIDNNLITPASSKTVDKTKRLVSDSWITTKVKSEILADSLSKGFDVSVDTVHGVVVLKGALANQDAIDHVTDLTKKIEGVKSVDTSALIVGGASGKKAG